ncbi:hypothetical protein LCGC14_0921680, partial [marine sediment metagenome]
MNIVNEATLPDPVELVRQAVKADLDSAVLKERRFDVAKNSIEWCTSHRYLNASDPLWPRQIEMLARFFEDVCYFCSDTDYVHNVLVDDSVGNVMDRFCLLEHGVCPRCQRNRLEMLQEWQRDPRYVKYHAWDSSVNLRGVPPNEFCGIWGQRSGKSFAVATFFWTYILHRYLAIPNVPAYYRLASNTVLEAVFVAPVKEQVKTYMWLPFFHVYDASPWFREYVDHLKSEEGKIGIPLYHRSVESLAFPSKRLAVYMKAANSGTLRGGTRIWATLDELGWFSATEDGKKRAGIKDGTEVFTSLNRSLRTVRTRANKRRSQLSDHDVLDAYMFCISSPSSVNDPIEQRAAIASKTPRMMHTRYATWEVNPEEDEETIREEEGSDEVKFKRDYCAQPPRAASPFIAQSPLLQQLVDHEQTTRKLFVYEVAAQVEHDTGITLLRPTLKRRAADKITPRVLTVDNGEKQNSFSVCMASYYPEHDGILLEEFLEVAPYRHHQVDLQWCYDELVLGLVNTFNVVAVYYDRWESSYAVRDLRTNHHIDAERYSLKWKDFDQFREDLRGSKIWFPVPECDPEELLQTNNLVER